MPDLTSPNDLSGPWEAVLSGDGGYLITLGDLDDNNHIEIAVVRRSALPKNEEDGYRRWPGWYSSEDVLLTTDDFDDDEDVAFRLALAQRVAGLLNAAEGMPLAEVERRLRNA